MKFQNEDEQDTWENMAAAALQGGESLGGAIACADGVVEAYRNRGGKSYRGWHPEENEEEPTDEAPQVPGV